MSDAKSHKFQISRSAIEDLQLMLWTLKRIPTAQRAREAFELAWQAMSKEDAFPTRIPTPPNEEDDE